MTAPRFLVSIVFDRAPGLTDAERRHVADVLRQIAAEVERGRLGAGSVLVPPMDNAVNGVRAHGTHRVASCATDRATS